MRSAALTVVALVAAVAATAMSATAGTTDPRAEKERLNRADMALAKRTNLRADDLDPAWRPVSVPADTDEGFECRGFDPDFSSFTITGKARSAFTRGAAGSILSAVEVYATRAMAIGDFRTGARPPLARCLREATEAGFRGGPAGVTGRVLSSTVVRAPRVGDRRFAVRLAAQVTAGGRTLPIVVDVLVFQRGRSIGVLMFSGIGERITGQAPIARTVAGRMK